MVFLVLGNIIYLTHAFAQEIIPLYKNLHFKECKVSTYASSIRYIALETKENCLLGEELEVIASRDYLFIHDFKEDIVYRFDSKTGRFLNTIGRRGQGPGEYKKLFGFYIDDQDKKCFLMDTYVSHIYVYNYEGEFLQDISGPYAPCRMERVDNRYIVNNVLYTQTKNELFLMDLQGNLLKKSILSTTSRIGFMVWPPFFYKHEDLCYYKNYLSENVYSINSKLEKKLVYYIDCGKKAINSKEDQYDARKGNLVKDKIVIGPIKGYKENLYIPYYTDKECLAIYNIKSGELFSVGKEDKAGLIDDLSGGPLVTIPYSIYTYDSCVAGQLISVIPFTEVEDLTLYENTPFGKVLKKMNEDSNPIIRVVILK